jgi:hypothetical protein
MGVWDTSPLTRTTAWYGIRMVRNLNKDFLEPLASSLPPERHGSLGDGPKLSCATCHQGAYKPLLGVSMLGDYMELAEAKPQPEKTVVAPPTAPQGPQADGGAPTTGPDDASHGPPTDAGAKSPLPASSGSAAPAATPATAPSAPSSSKSSAPAPAPSGSAHPAGTPTPPPSAQ